MLWNTKMAVDRAGRECSPGPGRSCRSGWQWWLQETVSWLKMQGPLSRPRSSAAPTQDPPGRRQDVDWGCQEPALRATYRPGSTTWGTVFGMSGTWLQHLRAPGEKKGRGWVKTEPGAGGHSTGQAWAPPPSSPAGASRCGRGRARGHCLLGPPQCPVARLEDRTGC